DKAQGERVKVKGLRIYKELTNFRHGKFYAQFLFLQIMLVLILCKLKLVFNVISSNIVSWKVM
ncbi:MAG: hypothetical protein O7C59_09840, partial [Rickettsia endosymbiont of Ixodes persulcatus]|nr:hypothetical protein [Rickettsia endosymbiont of Ixodes persulcatus]